MLVIRSLPPPTSNVWYLAYGSNLSASKFIHDRGITPLSTIVVTIPGWALTMDSAGVPYSEPSYASISSVYGSTKEKSTQLIGTAYELTPEMYVKVISSEGGGIAYAEIEVRAESVTRVGAEGSEDGGKPFAVRSLVTVLQREARPSVRYMGLLRTGAADSHMPISYQEFLARVPVYRAPTRPIPRIGAALFLGFWVPVMSAMEKITKSSLKNSKSGNAPFWVIVMVRAVVFTMWFYHDFFHAPIWGQGDGM